MGLFIIRPRGPDPVTACCRRTVLLSSIGSVLLCARGQDAQEQQPNRQLPPFGNPDKRDADRKLPNGKSQNDAIAKQNHQQALKDANDLIAVAAQLRDELQKAGNYVVPVSSVKKTEEIEKLARRIRGRLKD
jgi:Zn-dependent oligopeptidase